MKKIIILIAMILSLTVSAQFNKVSIEGGIGGHLIADQSAVLDNNFLNLNVTGRYNFNRTFGLGLYLAHNSFDFTKGNNDGYFRGSIEGVVDIFDVLKMDNDTFTLLGHGGIGISDFQSEQAGIIVGGFTGLFRLGDNIAIKADFTTAGNFMQDKTLNDFKATTNAGLNSIVYDFSIGVAFYLGKEKVHADWYVEPIKNDVIYERTIVEKVKDTIVNNYVTNEYKCDCDALEFVFFKHDKYNIEQSELNAITKIYDYMKKNPSKRLQIAGYASATKSSAEYNIVLSDKRVKAVYEKLKLMGLNMNTVVTTPYGKDFNWSNTKTHDVSRRVSLMVK